MLGWCPASNRHKRTSIIVMIVMIVIRSRGRWLRLSSRSMEVGCLGCGEGTEQERGRDCLVMSAVEEGGLFVATGADCF